MYLLHRRKTLAGTSRAFRKGVLPPGSDLLPLRSSTLLSPLSPSPLQNSKMLAGPVLVTMATEAKVELGRRRELSRDRASPRPDWSEIRREGGGWLDVR